MLENAKKQNKEKANRNTHLRQNKTTKKRTFINPSFDLKFWSLQRLYANRCHALSVKAKQNWYKRKKQINKNRTKSCTPNPSNTNCPSKSEAYLKSKNAQKTRQLRWIMNSANITAFHRLKSLSWKTPN